MQAGASGTAQARLKVQTLQHFSVAEAPMYDTLCENRPQQQRPDLLGHTFALQNERSEISYSFYRVNSYKNALGFPELCFLFLLKCTSSPFSKT